MASTRDTATTKDAKVIYSEAFFNQKLDYIHHNPVNEKLQLADDYIWYSSAAFYETGTSAPFQSFNYRKEASRAQ